MLFPAIYLLYDWPCGARSLKPLSLLTASLPWIAPSACSCRSHISCWVAAVNKEATSTLWALWWRLLLILAGVFWISHTDGSNQRSCLSGRRCRRCLDCWREHRLRTCNVFCRGEIDQERAELLQVALRLKDMAVSAWKASQGNTHTPEVKHTR